MIQEAQSMSIAMACLVWYGSVVMIEVPVPIVSVISYEILGSKKEWFMEYTKGHSYRKKENGAGFVEHVYLERSRAASLLLCPLEELRYDIQFNEKMRYFPKKLQYLDTAIFVDNYDILEIIGMNSRNQGIVKGTLHRIEDELGLEFRRHPTMSPQIFSYLARSHKTDNARVSRLAYYLAREKERMRRYEYGQDLTYRLSELKGSQIDLFAIGGNISLDGLRISFYVRRNGKIIIYNMVKTPLTWSNVFNFLDTIIYSREKEKEM